MWWIILLAGLARAGYTTVWVGESRQCGLTTVSWTGDDGPYHLLFTPTTFVSHGYNVWVESIPNGTTSYELPISQPAGMQFMVTVWGASGIEYAGTTDVLTVLSSDDTSCFMSNDDIFNLYSFAFNMTDNNSGFPPQCSNLTMSWPTSLRSGARADLNTTTTVPTMFGIIPLGNSFAIPVTYANTTNSTIPSSAISKNPTTTTSFGVTSLKWTVNLAKGTRFILVAGIGSKQQWASGGSTEMMTVGQGASSCLGDGPKVTGTSTPSAGPGPKGMSVAAVALASVFSVVGTLTLVAVLWFCCRIKRKRTRADRDGQPKPSVLNIASFGRLDRKRFTTRDPGTDTQLDLMGSSDYDYTPSVSSRPRLPLSPVSPMSPLSQRPFSVADSDYQRPFTVHGRGSTASFEASSRPSTMYDTYPPRPVDARSRSSMFDDYYPSSPLSPMSPVDRPPGDHLGRQASIDELVSYPLMALAGDDADVQLKRETLAYLDSNVAGPSRRPQSLTEPEYLVHRDAGRLAGDGPRRIELPPRYEELDWDSEAASLPPGVDSPALSPIDARPLPTVASPALSPTRPLPDSKT